MSLYDKNIMCEHIENLPDEMLLEIFNYFDGNELKILALVSQRWAYTIGTSASTMENLTLNLMRYSENPDKLHRNYFSVKIDHSKFGHDELEVIKEIRSSVQKLTISHTTFSNSEFKNILENLPHLKNLVLIKVDLNFNDEIIAQKHKVKLEKLKIIQSDHRILKYLDNHQILNFKIIDATNRKDPKSLVNFLAVQNDLKSIEIENLSDDPCAFFENFENFDTFNFRLNKFSVLYSHHIRDVEKFESKISAFLELNKQSLKKLKVAGNLTHQIYKYIIMNLNNIDDLEINVRELPQEISFYECLKQNRNLKLLRLNGTIKRENFIGFKGILLHYPGIERVWLADTDAFVANDIFHLLSVKLLNLFDVSLLNFHKTFSADTVFPSLKSFSMRVLNDINQWRKFINQNETIESLSVGWIKRDQFTIEIINDITNLRNLRHLKFGGRFIASKRIYDVIKSNYKNLRTLILTVANYDEIKKLTFVFPLNKTLWLTQCQYFDEGHDREPVNDW